MNLLQSKFSYSIAFAVLFFFYSVPLWIHVLCLWKILNQILQLRLCRKHEGDLWSWDKKSGGRNRLPGPWEEKYAHVTTTRCSMSYVLSSIWDWLIQKLAGEKLCPAPCDKDKVPVFGAHESKGQVTAGRETREGIWISHLGGGSMSLKTLISVSSRLTGDPSSCQRNFILFSKEFEAGFQSFFFFFS